jgi:hypothetical protein
MNILAHWPPAACSLLRHVAVGVDYTFLSKIKNIL